MAVMLMALTSTNLNADDWPRFRGPSGSGVASESTSIPTAWSPSANLAWKTELPGPGASSPIIVGGKAFVTCYSGYGVVEGNPGEIENLVRHLVCIDTQSGKKLWQKDIKAALPEDPYSGIGVTAHGYASHTPVSDGTNVYAFLGKSGVHAFDLDGKKLWEAEVGNESDPTKWGSSSSPIVFGDLVIVTASAESQAIVAFNKDSGKEVWRQEAKGLDGMWGTPTLVSIDENRTDLVMCVAKELWGLDPSNGKLRWFANATGAQHAYTSVVKDGKRVFAFTGRGGGSIAIDAGGTGDISETNTVWTGRDTSRFASPIRVGSKLYLVSNGVLTAVDAKTGDRIEQLRLKGAKQTGGRFGSLDYPSPIVAGNHLFYLNGSGQMYVFELGDKLKQVALNQVTSEKEVFWGTPAISDGKLVMRSAKYLYCVANKGEKVKIDPEMLAKTDEPESTPETGGGRGGRGGSGGGRQFDPMIIFNRMDTDKDGMITAKELEGNRMADRMIAMDKDGDKSVSAEEFRTGMAAAMAQGGGGGSRGGNRGGGGRGGYGDKDSRPDRPQRPESDSKK